MIPGLDRFREHFRGITARRLGGGPVDGKDTKKRRSDVLRLLQVVTTEPLDDVPKLVVTTPPGSPPWPERALADGVVLDGPTRVPVTMENLGAWRAMPCPPNTLLAHVPGWDTATARRLLSTLAPLPVLYFGDLDPAGVRIVTHLRAEVPRLRWFVPACWSDYVASHGQPRDWPPGIVPHDAPRLVHELAAARLWLEQEVVVLDPRFAGDLEAEITEVVAARDRT